MKTIFRTLTFAAVCAAALTACNKSDINIADPVNNDPVMCTVTLVAPQSTKASLQNDYTFRWDSFDEKLAFFERVSGEEISISDYTVTDDIKTYDDYARASFLVTLPSISDYLKQGYAAETLFDDINWDPKFIDGLTYSYTAIASAWPIEMYDDASNEVMFKLENDNEGDGTSMVPSDNIIVYAEAPAADKRFNYFTTVEAQLEYQHICSYGRINITEFPEGLNAAHSAHGTIGARFVDGNSDPYPISGNFNFNLGTHATDAYNPFWASEDHQKYEVFKRINFYLNEDETAVEPTDEEFWFVTIPETFETATMCVDFIFGDTMWTKEIAVDKPFTAGKIKVWDVDFTDLDVEQSEVVVVGSR